MFTGWHHKSCEECLRQDVINGDSAVSLLGGNKNICLHVKCWSCFYSTLTIKIYHPVNRLRSFMSSCHLVIWSLGHSVTRSLGHLVIRFLGHLVTWLLSHLVTWSLDHSVTQSLMIPLFSTFWLTDTHTHNIRTYRSASQTNMELQITNDMWHR